MVKVLGIDPGTRSFDLCGLEDGVVNYEEIVDTLEVASKPYKLIEAVEKDLPLDLIAGPSGYGVELTYLKNLDLNMLKNWYLTYILLLKREDLEKALKKREIGIMVYSAMTETALEMKRRNWPVVYIPGVINLPTVPKHRKVNKMDMGTADKMCIAVLGVHDQASRLGLSYRNVSFILVEMGFGYNAVIGVDKGRIVDGVGGTTGGPGFLTSGALDAEVVQLTGSWSKVDVFTGGGASIANKKSPEEIVSQTSKDEMSRIAWEAMMESIVKEVYSVKASVKYPKEILFSGRLTRIKGVEEELKRRLSSLGDVRRIGFLEGANKTKEAAQGYAMVADGLAGGKFKELIDWMKIREAKGTSIDFVYHPRAKKAVEEIRRKVPF